MGAVSHEVRNISGAISVICTNLSRRLELAQSVDRRPDTQPTRTHRLGRTTVACQGEVEGIVLTIPGTTAAIPNASWCTRLVGARYGVPQGMPWHAPTTAPRQGAMIAG